MADVPYRAAYWPWSSPKRPWFCSRVDNGNWQWLKDNRGAVRRFATQEAAQRVCDTFNACASKIAGARHG